MMQTRSLDFAVAAAAMAGVVLVSNIAVQYPLGNWLTWGALTYPFAFLVTDLANRRCGAGFARRVVVVGFVLAVALSYWLATPRLAFASGLAFLAAQLLDIAVFNRLRTATWWRAPFISSALSSVLDTAIFFTLAFAASFAVLGPNEPFALQPVGIIGDAPRWVGWAIGDLGVKLAFALVLLAPYRVLANRLGTPAAA